MANEVVIHVNADVAKAKAGLAGIADKMKAVGRGATIAGGLITGLGVASITQFAKMGDEVQKMALRTGFSTEALSELRVAAELSGSSLKGMETGIRRMSKVIVDAKDGLGESVDALDRMGVSVDDLMGKSPEEQFEILTAALADMSDKTEQVATAQEIFGRAGTALLPMLAGGSAALEEMKQKAHEMGVVFDQEAADKAARLADSFTTLKGSLQGVMLAIAEQLAPVVTDVAEKMGTAISKISTWTDANPGLTRVIVLVAAAVGGFLLVLGPLLLMLPGLIALAPMVGAAFHVMLGPFGLITLAITGLIALVAGLVIAWQRDFGGIRDITAKILQTLLDGFISFMRQFAKPMDFLIETFNRLTGTTIPSLSEALDKLDEVVIDFGEASKGAAKVVTQTWGGHMVQDVEKVDAAIANIGDNTIPNIVLPQIRNLGKAVDDAIDPFFEYGRRLERMKIPMEDLTDEADKLSKKFGISMSDAMDFITNIKMSELDSAQREFARDLLGLDGIGGAIDEIAHEKMNNLRQEFRDLSEEIAAFAVHRAPTGFQGGGATFGALPAGLQDQGGLTVGLEALGRGEDPSKAWEAMYGASANINLNIDGKQVASNLGDDVTIEGEL